MHLTLKKEATRPPAMNALQQQEKFDHFVDEFNRERLHETLGKKRPADVYVASKHAYRGLPDVSYPLHDRDIVLTACGRICMHRKKIPISTALAGQTLGLKEVDDDIWLVSFMDYDLGYIELEQRTLQPLDNPFGPKVVTGPDWILKSESEGLPETRAERSEGLRYLTFERLLWASLRGCLW
jgi:hypothetical protein